MKRPVRWIALTGTPGTGKTSLARMLRKQGFPVVDLKRFVARHGGVVGLDRARKSRIVDPERVGRLLRRLHGADSRLVLESHWSHAIPGVDAAIVLRVRPHALERRLRARGWSERKVIENAEAEALGIILEEARQKLRKRRVLQIDATRLAQASLARRVAAALRRPDERLTNVEIRPLNWSEDILRWF